MFETAVRAFGLPERMITHARRGVQLMLDRERRGRKAYRSGELVRVARGVAKLVRHAQMALTTWGALRGKKTVLSEYGERPWEIIEGVLEDESRLRGRPLGFEDLPVGAAPVAAVVGASPGGTGRINEVVEDALPDSFPLYTALVMAVLEDAAIVLEGRIGREGSKRYGELCRRYPGRKGSTFLLGTALWAWLEESVGGSVGVDSTQDEVARLAREPVARAVEERLEL